MPLATPLAQRFEGKVDRSGGPDACWPWTGATNGKGYGVLQRGRRGEGLIRAHRLAYELAHGEVGDDVVIDHECHNRDASCPGGDSCVHRRCCNPAHLVASSNRDNVLAGRTIAAEKAAQTHCIHGHAFTPSNTGRNSKNGTRFCRTCKREKSRLYRRGK